MKNLDLNETGVQEMNVTEMKATNGGGIIMAFIGAFVGAAIGSIWGEEETGGEIGAIIGLLIPIGF